MRKLLALGLVSGLLAVVPEAKAFGPCCPVPSAWCLPCCNLKLVPVRCVIQVPRCIPEKRIINICIPVCQWIEREVHCVRYVPTPCLDSCGHPYTSYRPEPYVSRVKVPVHSVRYEPREIVTHRIIYEPREVIRHVFSCVPCVPHELMPPAK